MSNKDCGSLKLLSMLHYLHGGLIVLFAVNIINRLGAFNLLEEGYDWRINSLLLISSIFPIVLGFSQIALGYFLSKNTQYKLSFLVACCECIFTPTGTILGVFAIILLSKDSVKKLFAK